MEDVGDIEFAHISRQLNGFQLDLPSSIVDWISLNSQKKLPDELLRQMFAKCLSLIKTVEISVEFFAI